MDKEKVKNDLVYMLGQLEKSHIDLYYLITKQNILNYINDLVKKTKIENKYDVIYITRKVIKKLSGQLDQHTTVESFDNSLNYIPFELKKFDNEICVINTTMEYQELKYAKLISINGASLKDIIDEFKACYSYNNDNSCLDFRILYSSMADYISLPSINIQNKELKFKFEKNNKIFEVTIPIFEKQDYKFPNFKNKNLTIDLVDGNLIINYSSCRISNEDMKKFINYIDNKINSNNINSIIVDLRNNGGGNDEPFQLLANYLKGINISTYTLINRYIFSAGVFAAYEMHNIGSTLIGEKMAMPLTHFGSVKETFTLPYSGITIKGSKKYFYIKNNKIECINSNEDFVKLDVKYKNIEFIKPDIMIEEKIDNLEKSDDIMLDYVINLHKGKKMI